MHNKIIAFYKDKDLLNSTLNSGSRIVTGPIILLLIPIFLSPQVQGYWFTFISVAALSIFADLGFTNIILQFSAHEFAFLEFRNMRLVPLKEEYIAHLYRISSLFRFMLSWVTIISVISFPVIFFAGYKLFIQKHDFVDWLTPWMLYTLASALSFIINVVLSFLEGCNMVGKIQNVRFIWNMLIAFTTIIMLLLGMNLYTIAFSSLFSSMVISAIIFISFRQVFGQMISISMKNYFNWSREIFRLFWKYVISFGSGYLIFQIYTPVAFHYYGPIEAGRIGLSLMIFSSVFMISNIWIVSVLPKFNMFVALKNWQDMDSLFKRRIKLGCVSYIFMTCVFFGVYFILKRQMFLVDRLTSPLSLILLALFWFLQFIISSWAIYLRAHKEEPYVWPSLVSAVYITAVTYIIAKNFASDFIFFGLISSSAILLPWLYYIFKKKKHLWHKI